MIVLHVKSKSCEFTEDAVHLLNPGKLLTPVPVAGKTCVRFAVPEFNIFVLINHVVVCSKFRRMKPLDRLSFEAGAALGARPHSRSGIVPPPGPEFQRCIYFLRYEWKGMDQSECRGWWEPIRTAEIRFSRFSRFSRY